MSDMTTGGDPMGGPDLSAYMDSAPVEGKEQVAATGQTTPAPQSKPVDIKDTMGASTDEKVKSGDKEYQATADKPSLPKNLNPKASTAPKERHAGDLADQDEEQFAEALGRMEPGLRQQVVKNMQKPPAEQDPDLGGFEEAVMAGGQDVVAAKNFVADQQGQQATGDVVAKGEMQISPELLAKMQSGEQLSKAEIAQLQQLVQSGELPPEQAAQVRDQLAQQGVETPTGKFEVPEEFAKATEGLKSGEIPNFAGQDLAAQMEKLGLGKVDPSTMNFQDIQTLAAKNGVQVLENQARVTQATADALPADDPGKMALNDFLKFIAEVIGEAKEFLALMKSMDADEAKKASVGQKEVMAAKLEKQMKQIEKAQKMKKKADTLGTIMKVVSIVMAVAFLVMAIVSGGSLLAIAIAAIGVLIAVIAATTTIIDDAFEAIVDKMVEVFKSMGMSDEMAEIMAMVVMIVLIIVVALITKGAAAKFGTKHVVDKLGPELAKKATTKVANAVAINVATTGITHSGVLTRGIKPFLTEVLGMDEETAEIVAMVIAMVAMLALMLAGAKQMMGASKAVAQSSTGSMGRGIEQIAQQLQMASSAVETLAQVLSAVMNIRMAGLAKEKSELEAQLAELDAQLEGYGLQREEITAGMEQIQDLSNFMSDSFVKIVESYSDIVSGATKAA